MNNMKKYMIPAISIKVPSHECFLLGTSDKEGYGDPMSNEFEFEEDEAGVVISKKKKSFWDD